MAMSGKIQVEAAGGVLSVVSNKKITFQEFFKRIKNSVSEFAGVYEIRVRLYLWELSGKARQQIARYGLNSTMTGKTAFLVVASCLFIAGGILMVWQSRSGIGNEVQTLHTAGFQPFNRPNHQAPGFAGRSRQAGFNGYEPLRGSGRFAPPKPEMTPRRFPEKNAIRAHARIVLSPSE